MKRFNLISASIFFAIGLATSISMMCGLGGSFLGGIVISGQSYMMCLQFFIMYRLENEVSENYDDSIKSRVKIKQLEREIDELKNK